MFLDRDALLENIGRFPQGIADTLEQALDAVNTASQQAESRRDPYLVLKP